MNKLRISDDSTLSLKKFSTTSMLCDEEYDGNTIINTSKLDVTDDGNGKIKGTLNDDGYGYFYVRLSQTGTMGALMRDIPAGTPVRLEWTVSAQGLGEVSTAVYGWGVGKEVVPNGQSERRIEYATASGDTSDYIRFYINGYAGDSITVDVTKISVREIL